MKKILLILLLSNSVFAQSGGTFQIENSSVASGGGRNSGGNFSLDSTAGQTLAGGVSQNSQFSIQNGFWTFNFAPTAATVSVGGRVLSADGRGIRNARVTLTAPDGTIRFATTATFGYYRFERIEAGQTYILRVSGKRFIFVNSTLILSVQEEIADADFMAEPQ